MQKLFSHLSANGLDCESFDFPRENIMEAYIEEHPDVLKFFDGDKIEIQGSQIKWLKKPSKDGRIDLLVSYGDRLLAIVELKKGELVEDDVRQLDDYFSQLLVLIKKEEVIKMVGETDIKNWFGVLVGTGVSVDLVKGFDSLKLSNSFPLGILQLRRFKGDRQTFVFSHIFRNPVFSKRDYTKYSLNGLGNYPKSRLVLTMVQEYLLKDPNVSYDELKDWFDVYRWTPSLQFLKPYADALQEVKDGRANWYFSKPDEVVLIQGNRYVVYNSWTKDDMPKLQGIAKKMGFEFKKVG